MAQIRRFYACWASFVAEEPPEGPCRANFFAEMPLEGRCWANYFAPTGPAPVLEATRRTTSALQVGGDGGFALHEALLRRVASVSNPRVVQFPPFGGSSAANTASCRSSCSAIPPFGGGAAVVRGGMAPTSQTTSMNHADNVLLVAKWSAFWAHQCLAVVWYSHANPQLRAVTRPIARKPVSESVGGAAQARVSGLTCGLAGPDDTCWVRAATHRAQVRISGFTCALVGLA